MMPLAFVTCHAMHVFDFAFYSWGFSGFRNRGVSNPWKDIYNPSPQQQHVAVFEKQTVLALKKFTCNVGIGRAKTIETAFVAFDSAYLNQHKR
jgi:hypothetical protein